MGVLVMKAQHGRDQDRDEQGDQRALAPQSRQHPAHRFQRAGSNQALADDHQRANGHQRLVAEAEEKLAGLKRAAIGVVRE
jgi:hypothetical protein